MSDNSASLNQSSQLNDDQIEELVREFELNTQALLESQSQDQSLDEESSHPQPPVNGDFQTEFIKRMCIGSDANELASKAATNYEQNTQHECDSQTDAETVMRAFMIGNPNRNENNASKPLDLESFLDTRDYFVTVKSGTSNQPTKSTSNQSESRKKCDNRFTLGPLPLEIEDIHRIAINIAESQRWNTYQKIYGQKIKTVMFYGRCKPFGSVNSQKGKNVKLYEVDDGSGMIVVHFPHFDANYSVLSRGVDQLLEEYGLARKEGIPYLGIDFGPKTAKCKEMLDNVNVILNVIRRNGAIKQEFFTHGCKVCVIGRAFSHSDGRNHVFAYNMIEDVDSNRDFEINFKKHLIEVYKTKYLAYKINGEVLDT